jgi:hypothetical protein
MSSCRPSPITGQIAGFGLALAALWTASPADAQTTATAPTSGSTSIGAPASITVTQNLSFTVLPQSVNTGLTITSSAAGGVNANVVVTGGQAASVSVPATIDVTRVGGAETVTVRTVGPVTNVVAANGPTQVTGIVSGGIFTAPVTIVGTIDSGVLSFSVGGQITVANNLVPGQYQGVLTVIAQFN